MTSSSNKFGSFLWLYWQPFYRSRNALDNEFRCQKFFIHVENIGTIWTISFKIRMKIEKEHLLLCLTSHEFAFYVGFVFFSSLKSILQGVLTKGHSWLVTQPVLSPTQQGLTWVPHWVLQGFAWHVFLVQNSETQLWYSVFSLLDHTLWDQGPC